MNSTESNVSRTRASATKTTLLKYYNMYIRLAAAETKIQIKQQYMNKALDYLIAIKQK